MRTDVVCCLVVAGGTSSRLRLHIRGNAMDKCSGRIFRSILRKSAGGGQQGLCLLDETMPEINKRGRTSMHVGQWLRGVGGEMKRGRGCEKEKEKQPRRRSYSWKSMRSKSHVGPVLHVRFSALYMTGQLSVFFLSFFYSFLFLLYLLLYFFFFSYPPILYLFLATN